MPSITDMQVPGKIQKADWTAVEALAEIAARRIPPAEWSYDDKMKRSTGAKEYNHSLHNYTRQHFVDVGFFGTIHVYLGADGGLYMPSMPYGYELLTARHFSSDTMTDIGDVLARFFKISDGHDMLYRIITDHQRRIATLPANDWYYADVFVKLRRRGDDSKRKPRKGKEHYFNHLRHRVVNDDHLIIDERGRLVEWSSEHRGLLVVEPCEIEQFGTHQLEQHLRMLQSIR